MYFQKLLKYLPYNLFNKKIFYINPSTKKSAQITRRCIAAKDHHQVNISVGRNMKRFSLMYFFHFFHVITQGMKKNKSSLKLNKTFKNKMPFLERCWIKWEQDEMIWKDGVVEQQQQCQKIPRENDFPLFVFSLKSNAILFVRQRQQPEYYI